MKLTHRCTKFNFADDEGNSYDVICMAAKWQENKFNVYKNSKLIYTYMPLGGHVNKTMAKMILLKTITKNNE